MIRLKNVSKEFILFNGGSNSLLKRSKALFNARKYYTKIEALKKVNLQVKKGEFVSVIGANGSGKTTLLKVIAQVLKPTAGEVTVQGTLVPLLELGIGFHPELNAKENIYVYGSLLGMPRKEIREKTAKILSFAELQAFAHAPLRTFSSGMQARLAFATAIQINPDILLVDEVLAVGDIAFQQKCLQAFERFKQQEKTMILVSHDLHIVNKFSDKVVLLHKGKVVQTGKPYPTIRRYHQIMRDHYKTIISTNPQLSALEKAQLEIQKRDIEIQKRDIEIQKRDQYITWLKGFTALPKARWGSKEIEITKVLLFDQEKNITHTFHTGDFMKIRIFYKVHKLVENPVFGIRICSRLLHYFGTNTQIAKCKIPKLKKKGFVDCDIFQLPFLEGNFALSVSVHSTDDKHYDWHDNLYHFEIKRTKKSAGVIDIAYHWNIQNAI